MKRIILSCMLLIAGMAKAQVPNGSFESWKTFSIGPLSFEYPENFLTSNFATFQGADPSVVQVAGINGGKATALINVSYDDNGQTELMSGLLSSLNGELKFSGNWNNKFPISGKPEKFEGYYSFSPVQGDTFSIIAILYQEGLPVAVIDFEDNTEVIGLTKFSFPIDYDMPSAQPDSASITILSSSNEIIHEGTTLVIDELSFKMPGGNSLGITQNDVFEGKVFPNPANNVLNIQFNELLESEYKIELFDLSGKLLKTESVQANSNAIALDITTLPKGIIYGRISNAIEQKSFKTIKL